MEKLKNVKLGDILVNSNALTPSQLESALQEQRQSGMRLGEILIKNGWLSENQLIEALSTQLHIPQVSISRYRPEPEALRLIPQVMAERLKVIPMRITDEDHLMVATSDPLNLVAADELRMMSGKDVDFGLCPGSQILRDLSRIYTMQESLDVAEVEVVSSSTEGIELDLGQAISTAAADDAPVINLVNTILEQAVKDRSSDIHIEPFEKDTQVRYRVDGQLFNATNFSRGLHPAVTSRIKIMANIDISEKRKPQDGRILIKLMDRRVDLRVSTLPTVYGEKTVIRVLDQTNAMVGLEKLGFEQQDRDKIDRLLKVPYGIILVTGPTGSGKSTTLYSFLERINTPDVNIVTVEDPVEYSIAGINQVQVSEKAGRTFGSVLRAILRQDPDKIMIGEIRDSETANLAIRAALTGHLVLSTLHTNDAPSAPIRLGDMGVPPFLVASSVVAVIAQRLVRRICPDCKIEYTVEDHICRLLGLPEGSKAYRSRGCDTCRGTGHVGRTSIFEIMEMSEDIRNRIIDQETAVSIKKAAIERGMRTLREAALARVLDGTTTVEEMLNVTTLQRSETKMALTIGMQDLLRDVIKKKSSDLHLSVGNPPAMRLDGHLIKMSNAGIVEKEDMQTIVSGLLSEDQMETLESTKEMDFSFSFQGQDYNARFRGNCFYELGQLAMALRLIPTDIRTIDQLMLPPALADICDQKRGLFLVTGPTGHGKSTTLAACLQHINLTRKEHIITIEDPIEYLYRSENSIVHQREIGSDTKSFSEALKRALRQDPDVILIGEMRDLETIGAAITAAETGHLVFATLHTRDASQSIDRIIDVFPPHQQQQIRLQLASSLVGICSQQLIPMPGGGRTVGTELLRVNPAVRNCIREGKTNQIKTVMQTGSDVGMHTMEQDLARLVLRGILTFDQAAHYAYDRKDFERLVFEGGENQP